MKKGEGETKTAAKAIVIHSVIHGDPLRILELPAALRSDDALRRPPAKYTLPDGVRDPRAQEPPSAAKARQPTRVLGLDAMRGVCVLAMNLSFAWPTNMILPAWMYHMQYPPPNAAFVPQSGLTWTDLVFPGFLFAMAAAVSVRGTQLMESGEPMPSIIWGALKRTALLYVFALIIGHTNPNETKLFTKVGNLLAMAGFVTCFALFVRQRADWNPRVFSWIRKGAWLSAALLLFIVPLGWGGGFSPTRRDGIIVSIAFVHIISLLMWLPTRHRPFLRVALMFAVAMLKVLAPAVAFVAALWARSAMPWIYEPWYFELLMIAIPGTIAGDYLVKWMRGASAEPGEVVARNRLMGAAALGFIIPLILLVGLYQDRYLATMSALGAVLAIGAWLLHNGETVRGRLLAYMGAWTGALLAIGLLLEPLEGGVRKDPQTMSFLLLCAGIWFGVLLAVTILIDVVGGKFRTLSRPLILTGQNAMLAYVIFMLGIMHLAYFAGFGEILSDTPAAQLLRGALVVALVAAIVGWATTRRIVWRA